MSSMSGLAAVEQRKVQRTGIVKKKIKSQEIH